MQILRETDKILKEMEAQYYAKDRLALVHGNRFVLHIVFKEYRDAGFEIKAAMLDGDTIKEKTRSFCTAIIPKQIEAMNNVFPDAYLANILRMLADAVNF